MKKQSIFYGIIVSGLALILIVENWDLAPGGIWTVWPALLLAGFAFLVESLSGRIPLSFLPGVLLLLLGAHFYLLQFTAFWPDHIGMYFLYFGAAFLVDSLKTRNSGLFTGILLSAAGAGFLYSSELRQASGTQVSYIVEMFFPIVLLGFGVYMIIVRR
ncbi:hypothetical protein [Salibacterium halotolerans]|uniref:DUF5668 domain-containing protein n=1 Tax=Salibacterium halotolerans TaxID=1884432 RepID=A0A1I5ST56_9BACI|nr:hypothetical protein [Salibacterium halotolerans]SFP73436.1 hypothetical protein SAMN05518683_10966 [Salibacterium halotolerans]